METNKNDLKIIELRGENFKKIKTIVIRPDDDLVLITGKNAQGKSSAIDLIIAMLCKDRKWIPQPIRKGQTHADGRLDLGEFIVTCKWTKKGKYLKVVSREGLVYPSPQAMLDDFVGKLGFDIGKFFNMEEKEQTKILMELAELDFTEVDNKIERLVEERRLQGQKVKLLSGGREEITIDNLPELPINTSKLSNKFDEAISVNNEIKDTMNQSQSNSSDILKNLTYIEKLKGEISELEEENRRIAESNTKLNDWLAKNKPIETDTIKQEIVDAHKMNEQIGARRRNKEKDENYKYELSIYEKQTADIEKLRESKNKDLQEAKFPLPELKVTSAGTFFNDIPIKQLSSSENMKVAMSIGMALNEKFKVILVKDASLLDKENRKVIKEMAKDGGYQVWLEMVSDTGEMGFYFVDGEIESVNGEKQDRLVDAEFDEGGVEDES